MQQVFTEIGNHNMIDFRPLLNEGFYLDLKCSIRDTVREYTS